MLDFDCTNHKYAKYLIGNTKQQAIWEVTLDSLCPTNLNQTRPATQRTQSFCKLAEIWPTD